MTLKNNLLFLRNIMHNTRRIDQKTFLMQFQTLFDVKQPIWCSSEDTFAIKDENLVNAADITVEHAIGRYRLTLKNSSVFEVIIDVDNHDGLTFKEYKDKRLLPSYKHLLYLGIPAEYIYAKSSGTGIHFHVFIEGLPENFDPAELLMKVNPQEADTCTQKEKQKIREWGAKASTGKGYTTYIQDVTKLKSIPSTEESVYPNIKPFKATKYFIQQLSFIEMDRKQSKNESEDNDVDYERDGDPQDLYKCPLLVKLAADAKNNRHLYHNDRLFFMSQFLHFGEASRKEIHNVMQHCSDYDEGYTDAMILHAMKRGYHPFTCKWAHQMKLGCPVDCKGSGGKSPLKFAWTPLSLAELKAEYRKSVLLAPEDDEIIEVALSQVLDPQFDGELAWMFLIAPPSWAKTVILASVHDQRWSEMLDKITDKTFFTGMTKTDKTGQQVPIEGLLPKLHMRTLILKEFTTVLMEGEDKRRSIFGEMRAIYDGNYSQAFGSFDYNLIPEEWKHVRMGFFAGCTPYIDKYSVLNAALGERYLKIRMSEPDRRAAAKYALMSTQERNSRTKLLQKKAKRFLANLKIPTKFEYPKEYLIDALVDLAEFTVQVRAPVERSSNGFGSYSYEYSDQKELGTRIVQQFARKGWALTVVTGTEFDNNIYALLFRIAMDTLHPNRKEIVLYLYGKDSAITKSAIRKELGWGHNRLDQTLIELKFIKVVDEDGELYKLNSYIRECLNGAMKPLPPQHRGRYSYTHTPQHQSNTMVDGALHPKGIHHNNVSNNREIEGIQSRVPSNIGNTTEEKSNTGNDEWLTGDSHEHD